MQEKVFRKARNLNMLRVRSTPKAYLAFDKLRLALEAKMTEEPGGRSGDLFDSGMGDLGTDVHGGQVTFDHGEPGVDHHSVYGDGGHFSWDSKPGGEVSGAHETLHDPG
jgi:hypothetical protein